MIPKHLADDPRVSDLCINQFVIDDGWIGVAVGPARQPSTASDSTSYEARRPKPKPGQ
jgi:hypothetical protein